MSNRGDPQFNSKTKQRRVERSAAGSQSHPTRRQMISQLAVAISVTAGCGTVEDIFTTRENTMQKSTPADTKSEKPPQVVTNEENLQRALNEYDSVQIRGQIRLESSVTVPPYTTLYGYGTYSYNDDEVVGDSIRGQIQGPLLNCKYSSGVFGLGLYNGHSRGDAIHCTEGLNRLIKIDVFANRYGIKCDFSDGYGSPVETIVHMCRFTGPDDVFGSVGVRNLNFTDVEIRNNIFRNLARGVVTEEGTMFISQNHFYCGSQSELAATNLEVRQGGSYVSVHGNYLEGNVYTTAICKTTFRFRFLNNLCRTQVEGGHGLFFNLNDSNESIPLDGCLIKNNEFSTRNGRGGTAIKTAGVDGKTNGTVVTDNIIPTDEWESMGIGS